MTFDEAKGIIKWMKEQNVQQFEFEGLKISFNNLAFLENAAKIEKKIAKSSGSDTKELTPEQEAEAMLFASA